MQLFVELQRKRGKSSTLMRTLPNWFAINLIIYQVRHIKLVHSQNHHQPISPSLGEGGESLILPNSHEDFVAAHKTQSQILTTPYR